MSERTLSHFAGFRLGDRLWTYPPEERAEITRLWTDELRGAAPRCELYQVYPSRGDLDLLVWSALPVGSPEAPADFFRRFARATGHRRRSFEPDLTLWGVTRPSPYARRGSDRAIDAVAGERSRYLIVYPFVKTADWYLLDAEERQRMMNEHIRVGRQFGSVRQLLLYSFGLQDQDFVVVYETEDLLEFSDLVHKLRVTEARRFTQRDTPILTAVHQPDDSLLELLR